MNVLITGTSSGIGKAAALLFLQNGFTVYGIDIKDSSIEDDNYHHYIADIKDKDSLPSLPEIDILINNAGVQNSGHDIDTNLKGSINVTEKYGIHEGIKSILFNASASASTGYEFGEYVASKAGLIGYMKNIACKVAKYKATCNSLSLGGVVTDLNKPVMEDKKMWQKIMDVTPLKKWATVEEVASWIYFLTVINKSASGIDIVVDNGESNLNNTFVWPDYKL